MLYWNPDLSYLDQPSTGAWMHGGWDGPFRAQGIHYVRWSDVVFNVAARPRTGFKMLALIGWSTFLAANGEFDWITWLGDDNRFDKELIGFFTVGLAFLIGVRINLSYDRYYEARKVWGMMVNRTRDVARQFVCYTDDDEVIDHGIKWSIAFVYSCKAALRWKSEVSDLTDLLTDDELAGLNGAAHMPNYCMEQVTDAIKMALDRGCIDTIQATHMDANVVTFEDDIGKCERIIKTPVPFVFVLHLRTIILAYIFMLPLYLIHHLEYGTIAAAVVIGYSYTALEDLGSMIENPFRENFHALPLNGLCSTIKKNLLEIQARKRQKVPHKLQPQANPSFKGVAQC